MSAPRTIVQQGRRAVQRYIRVFRRPAIFHSALLALLIAVFLLASAQVRAYTDGVQIDAFIIHGTVDTPTLRYTPPADKQLPVIAVIAHGYAADKEIMSSFAVDLAKQGITVYTFDFPGHGASTAYYGGATHQVVKQIVATLGDVVDYAQAHAPSPNTKIVLLGYSLGTIAVGEYAFQHPDMKNLQATVLVAGILSDKPTTTNPRNLLVLSGQFDLPGINDIARNAIAAACGAPVTQIKGTSYQCEINATDWRRRVILPGLDHISIVTASSTHDVVLAWLGKTVDPRIGQTPVIADLRLHWMLIGFLAALLAVAPLIRLLSMLFRIHPAWVRVWPAEPVDGRPAGMPRWMGILALPAALLVALVALWAALPRSFWGPDPFPFSFLRQQVSADVAIYFLFAGAALAAIVWGIPRLRAYITPPPWREAPRQALIAVAVTAFLVVTLGGLSSYAWESLALEPQRLWRGAVYALMIWPFFFALRSLLFAMSPRLKHPILADIGAGLLMIATLVGAIVMNFDRLSYLGILLPIVGILILLLAGVATWTRLTLRHPVILVSTLEALLMAWILSATLPLVM